MGLPIRHLLALFARRRGMADRRRLGCFVVISHSRVLHNARAYDNAGAMFVSNVDGCVHTSSMDACLSCLPSITKNSSFLVDFPIKRGAFVLRSMPFSAPFVDRV